ncbi:MAG: TolC family protein [Odoribacteraceae bacterium]|jgi:outer membrane protein TolC|nr:TolC family protein [Odoribacteraceae bacterium]
MRGVIFFVLFFLPGIRGFAQLSLVECQERARANYPLVRQYDLIERAREFDLINANKGYLPRLSITARATYQSEVTRLPVQLPGVEVEELNRAQYQAVVELNQLLWDGGAIAARKRMATTDAATRRHQAEVEHYALRERVNQLFFGVLLAEEQLKMNALMQEELRGVREQLAARVAQGLAHASDLDAVRVEQVHVEQQAIEIRTTHNAYRVMLGVLIGEEIDALAKPTADARVSEATRPELALFRARREHQAVHLGLLQAGIRPRVSLFMQGGYGNPGLNMLKNEFTGYYAGGIRFSWNISNLYTIREERRQVSLQQEMVDVQRETFLLNLAMESKRGEEEVEKWRALLFQDDEIVALQEHIAESAAGRTREGAMSVLEWMREVTRLDQARQARAWHEMQWLLSTYTLKQIKGE